MCLTLPVMSILPFIRWLCRLEKLVQLWRFLRFVSQRAFDIVAAPKPFRPFVTRCVEFRKG